MVKPINVLQETVDVAVALCETGNQVTEKRADAGKVTQAVIPAHRYPNTRSL